MAQETDPRDDWGGLKGGDRSSANHRLYKTPERSLAVTSQRRLRALRKTDAFFITAEQAGQMIGMQEVDARALMERGVIQAYWHRSHLKTSKQDVELFLSQLRDGIISVPNVVVPVAKDPSCFLQKGGE